MSGVRGQIGDTWTQMAWIGGILKDRRGEMFAAYTVAIPMAHPLWAELAALLKGVIISQTPEINLQRAGILPWNFMALWKQLLDALVKFSIRIE